MYNAEGRKLKTFFKRDGYERIRLYSKCHNRRVNRSIHLLVAEAFGKKLNKYPDKEVYQGGVTFSLKEIDVIRKRPVIAFRDRDDLWKTLAAN